MTGYQVPYLVNFISKNEIVYGLHLAVFRRNIVDSIFEMVAEDYLKAFGVPGNVKGVKVAFKSPKPLAVKQGDMIGLY